MWNMKCMIPVTAGAIGTVTKGLKKYLEAMPGRKHLTDSLQYSHTRNATHNTESTAM
jgi:hypothetical protein